MRRCVEIGATAGSGRSRRIGMRSTRRPLRAQLLDTPCQVNFELTHSKQRKGVTIKCHTFRGSDCATVTLGVASILRNSAHPERISNRKLPLLESTLNYWKQTIASRSNRKKTRERKIVRVLVCGRDQRVRAPSSNPSFRCKQSVSPAAVADFAGARQR
jgi:hypothetical protein